MVRKGSTSPDLRLRIDDDAGEFARADGSLNRSLAASHTSMENQSAGQMAERPDMAVDFGALRPLLPSAPSRERVRQTLSQRIDQPITGPTDPRWLLAVRTSEQLQGAILGPEKRERLVRLGGMLHLSAFDANLVIAVVQDQARRGVAPQRCPHRGAEPLSMIALPRRRSTWTRRKLLWRAVIIGAALLIEGLIVAAWFG